MTIDCSKLEDIPSFGLQLSKAHDRIVGAGGSDRSVGVAVPPVLIPDNSVVVVGDNRQARFKQVVVSLWLVNAREIHDRTFLPVGKQRS